MPCIHGLDEVNCPICRMTQSSSPENLNNVYSPHQDELKPNNPFYDEFLTQKEDWKKELQQNITFNKSLIINPPIKPFIFHQPPDFKNDMFYTRLNEIDIAKSDAFGISKKISLQNPEWTLKKKKSEDKRF